MTFMPFPKSSTPSCHSQSKPTAQATSVDRNDSALELRGKTSRLQAFAAQRLPSELVLEGILESQPAGQPASQSYQLRDRFWSYTQSRRGYASRNTLSSFTFSFAAQ